MTVLIVTWSRGGGNDHEDVDGGAGRRELPDENEDENHNHNHEPRRRPRLSPCCVHGHAHDPRRKPRPRPRR